MSRADCDVCDEKTTELYEQLAAKDAEIAKWKQIAIKHLAWAKFIEDELDAVPQEKSYEDYREKYEREATNELGIQISQEDEDLTIAYMLGSKKANERLKVLQGYVSRLEADYLSWVQAYYRDLGEEVAMQRAQDALEKIRHET